MKELFTMEECMEQLGCKQSNIQKKLRSGELKRVYISEPGKKGFKRYITIASVAKYIIKKTGRAK